MAIVTGDRYLEKLVKFVEAQAGMLIEGTLVLKLNPAGLHYVQSRLESLHELERLLAWAPVDYLRAYVSDLGDHRALEQLRRILRLLTSLKVVSVLPPPSRDPTPLSLLPFGRLRFLELRGCDLSTSAARGLLELRHTLERLICHNSTDALRHVFASRIAEIKDSPQWNRLSFVSCACNDLLLMDESLQLLPAVETLDLSRNKFSKLDNLRKCLKLKHLDLGFNNLRTISSFTEVTPQIVKLVLRNNAITSLHGIENLKSLEGLDVSYNAISNFSELETLAGLPSLLSLWLEGNPISCARRYRAHVFSLFTYPEKLKLDDKGISTREYWKRQIIIASRQKRPASYGFYSPAKDGGGEEGNINLKKKKRSRLASIETEEESTCVFSDRDSLSCDYEASSKEEVGCDDEAEIVDLMKRAEFMKKERSTLWLREFKEWMDQSSVNSTVNGILNHKAEKYTESKSSHWHFGERSRFVSDSFPISQENINTNVLEADNIFSDMFSLSGDHQVCDQTAAEGGAGVVSQPVQGTDNTQEHSKVHLDDNHWSKHSKGLHFNTLISKEQHLAVNSSLSASAVDDKKEDHSSSSYPGSPPHYQANILHRRKDLVEEILHLSADSNSVTSSDSSTSSEDDFILDANETLNGGSEKWDGDEHMLISSFHEKCDDFRSLFARVGEIGQQLMGHSEKQPSTALDVSMQVPNNYSDFHNPVSVNRGAEQAEKRKGKRKPVKRVVALSAETSLVDQSGLLANSSDREDSYCLEDAHNKQILGGRDLEEVSQRQSQTRVRTPVTDAASGRAKSSGGSDEFIENYFNMNVTASRTHETCTQYLRCDCVLEQESIYREREVALLQSSEHRLYVLLIGVRLDGSGIILSMLGCHMVEEIREVSVGMAFQVVRVCIDSGARYLFITRGVEKSRQLLETLEVMDSFATKLSWKSLEQVQVELFRKQICGAAKMNIFQYSMILFWHNKIKDKSWASRSLFVTRGQLLICMEDIRQFGALSKGSSSTPYFSLVSSCNVGDVSEMVVDEGSGHCVTLVLEHATLQFCPSIKVNNDITATPNENLSSGTLTWKIKWSSEKGLFQFVTLLKALHAATGSPLFIRHVS